MTTIKQILCAILNWGHKYEGVEYDWFGKPRSKVNKYCSCGKVWERKQKPRILHRNGKLSRESFYKDWQEGLWDWEEEENKINKE